MRCGKAGLGFAVSRGRKDLRKLFRQKDFLRGESVDLE
jgi:hypothetical protein